jgi:hypothetical protein
VSDPDLRDGSKHTVTTLTTERLHRDWCTTHFHDVHDPLNGLCVAEAEIAGGTVTLESDPPAGDTHTAGVRLSFRSDNTLSVDQAREVAHLILRLCDRLEA